MRVVLYLRYSSAKQTEQSIEGQDRVCTEWAARNGHTVVNRYIDRAISGREADKRAAFQRMIKDSAKGTFDAVVVYKLDRFARSRYDSAIYKNKLKANNVRIFSAMENITDTPESIILESVLEGFAEYYSQDLSQKVKRGMMETARKNKYTGGIVPFGYCIINGNYIADEKNAPIVYSIFQQVANGRSQSEIIRDLNKMGVKTARGAEWNKNSLRVLLRNTKYVGYYHYGEYACEGGIPPLIPRELFDKVQHILATQKKKTKAHVDYLLSGKVFYHNNPMLGNCGRGYNGTTYYYYKTLPKVEPKLCIPKAKLEQTVIDDLMSFLTDDIIHQLAKHVAENTKRRATDNSELTILQNQQAELKASIGRMADAVAQGVGVSVFSERIEKAEKDLSEVETRITEILSTAMPYISEDEVLDYFGHLKNEKVYSALIDYFVVRIDIENVTGEDYNVRYKLRFLGNSSETERMGSPKEDYPNYSFVVVGVEVSFNCGFVCFTTQKHQLK